MNSILSCEVCFRIMIVIVPMDIDGCTSLILIVLTIQTTKLSLVIERVNVFEFKYV